MQHLRNSYDVLLPEDVASSVVIELFTSQECSNSPLAAALLAYHAEYYDKLGWQDTHTSQEFSAYQRRYGRKFQMNSYPHEMVVIPI